MPTCCTETTSGVWNGTTVELTGGLVSSCWVPGVSNIEVTFLSVAGEGDGTLQFSGNWYLENMFWDIEPALWASGLVDVDYTAGTCLSATVYGCEFGSSQANGTYTQVGIVDGKASYYNSTWYIIWYAAGNEWLISSTQSDVDAKYASDDLISTNWTLRGTGSNPPGYTSYSPCSATSSSSSSTPSSSSSTQSSSSVVPSTSSSSSTSPSSSSSTQSSSSVVPSTSSSSSTAPSSSSSTSPSSSSSTSPSSSSSTAPSSSSSTAPSSSSSTAPSSSSSTAPSSSSSTAPSQPETVRYWVKGGIHSYRDRFQSAGTARV